MYRLVSTEGANFTLMLLIDLLISFVVLTVISPLSAKMFLAQLFICRNLSGPSWTPPYHLVTTTRTLCASTIWETKKKLLSRLKFDDAIL